MTSPANGRHPQPSRDREANPAGFRAGDRPRVEVQALRGPIDATQIQTPE
jgi:hypothetical protein